MSTRALYSVFDGSAKLPAANIYIHHDGYPSGALDHIKAALRFAWPLPRFEADEFAAALCAGRKASYAMEFIEAIERETKGEKHPSDWHTPAKARDMLRDYVGGGVRVFKSGAPIKCDAADIEYRYEIRHDGKNLKIRAFATHYGEEPRTEQQIFDGPFGTFAAWAKVYGK